MRARALAALALLTAACATRPAPAPVLLGPVTALVATARGLLACSQAGITRVDVEPMQLLHTSELRLVALAWDETNDTLFAAGGIPGERGVVLAWRGTGACASVELADDLVVALALDPQRTTLACGCDDGRVVLLDAATLVERATPRTHGGPVPALAFRGDALASGGHDGLLRLGDATDPTPLVIADHADAVLALAWSSEGSWLASGSRDGRIRCHDPSGRLLASSPALRTPVLGLAALSPGADRVIATLADGRALVMDLRGDVREVLPA
ncbi:MAG: hypothetical protein IT457_03630, partial [Planctomycetes bacterium]|nr:hypothetical protein [Planctomycetota bacterium]